MNKLAHLLIHQFRFQHKNFSIELKKALDQELDGHVIGKREREIQQNIKKEFIEMLIEKGIIEIKQTI